jgi:hypothetical protein
MFTNKHVVIAAIVAPVLAILAWFAVGQIAAEKAAPAEVGSSYPMIEKSNCRYESGFCDLENEDFKLILSLEPGLQGFDLMVNASHSLDTVLVAISVPADKRQPAQMKDIGGNGRLWRMQLQRLPLPEERIRVAVSSAGRTWFADAGTTFIDKYR